jgi:hypothetical protein
MGSHKSGKENRIVTRTMPTATRIDPNNPREIRLPLPLKYLGKQPTNLDEAITELRTYLKDRYPEVEQVRLALEGLPPKDAQPDLEAVIQTQYSVLAESAIWIWILIGLSKNPFTNKLVEDIADDAYKWLKKKFKIKKRRGKKRRKKSAR